MTAYIAVGDADGHPNGTTVGVDSVASLSHFRSVAFGHDFHVPHFVGIADAERLAVTSIAILLHQVGHHFDGFSGRLAALQSDEHEAAVVDDACRVHQLLATAKGGLTKGHLKFIDITHNLVSVRWLRHTATWRVGTTVVTNTHAALGPVGGRGEVQFAVADMRVGAITDEVGTIDAGTFGNQEVGACLRLAECGKQGDEKKRVDVFHW